MNNDNKENDINNTNNIKSCCSNNSKQCDNCKITADNIIKLSCNHQYCSQCINTLLINDNDSDNSKKKYTDFHFKLLNYVEDIKENISDMKYKNILDCIAENGKQESLQCIDNNIKMITCKICNKKSIHEFKTNHDFFKDISKITNKISTYKDDDQDTKVAMLLYMFDYIIKNYKAVMNDPVFINSDFLSSTYEKCISFSKIDERFKKYESKLHKIINQK